MQKLYDLHTHSLWSDGDWPPRRVAQTAKKIGLAGVILTDHNTILGWPEFERAVEEIGFEFVQGVEINSTLYQTDLHILGYSKNFNLKILNPLLKKQRTLNRKRLQKILSKLKKAGLAANINLTHLQEKKGQKSLLTKYDLQKESAKHLAMGVKEAGLLLNPRNAPAYVPYEKNMPSPQEVINTIHSANGLAVLAHPGEIMKRTGSKKIGKVLIQKIIAEVIKAGINGLEVFSPRHTKEQEQLFLEIAEKAGLFKTGGSDFHGPVHAPNRPLGSAIIGQGLWQKFYCRLPN